VTNLLAQNSVCNALIKEKWPVNGATSLFDIINNIPIGIFSATLQGKMVFCSNKFAAILGYQSPIELLEAPETALPLKRKEAHAIYQVLAEKGEIINRPVAMVKKNGSPVLCAITARAVSDKYGLNFLLDGLIKEIPKERKSFRQRGTESMDFYLNLDGLITKISAGAASFLGRPKDELLYKRLTNFIPNEYHDFLNLSIQKILHTGSQQMVISLKNDRNLKSHVEVSARLVAETGRRQSIQGMLRPMSASSAQCISRRDRNRDRFEGVLEMAGGVAHKLNQPLTTMNHMVEDLLSSATQSHWLYPKIARLSQQLEQVNTLAQQIKNIKSYSVTEYVSDLHIIDLDRAC
jgi:PAS domain-containing protein